MSQHPSHPMKKIQAELEEMKEARDEANELRTQLLEHNSAIKLHVDDTPPAEEAFESTAQESPVMSASSHEDPQTPRESAEQIQPIWDEAPDDATEALLEQNMHSFQQAKTDIAQALEKDFTSIFKMQQTMFDMSMTYWKGWLDAIATPAAPIKQPAEEDVA